MFRDYIRVGVGNFILSFCFFFSTSSYCMNKTKDDQIAKKSEAEAHSVIPPYEFDYYDRCFSKKNLDIEGYSALQNDYPHDFKNFTQTKNAMEKILFDVKNGTFKNPGMQMILDYMHMWYVIDPGQVYSHGQDKYESTGEKKLWPEFVIRDLAAQILDELQHTGGTAYARLH